MEEEKVEVVAEPVTETPVEVSASEVAVENPQPETVLEGALQGQFTDVGHGHEEPAVDLNSSENITEIHTPEAVTTSEIMQPARSPTSGKEFLKSLLPKLREKLAGRTEKRLSKIMELARKKGEIQNDDVEKLLHVSDATATNYLKKLVDRGELKVSGFKKSTKYTPV